MSTMGDKVLVAYATRYGSTREVADAVAAGLRGHGTEVEVKPAKDVPALGAYVGVVLAAPFYLGAMLKDATAFLQRHRGELEAMPVALLALGPTRASDDMAEARKQLDRLFSKLEWFKPVAAEMFVGTYDPARLRLPDKLITLPPASPLHDMAATDERDWDAIRAWADTLPRAMGVS